MEDELLPVAALEKQLARDPGSKLVLEDLLSAYLSSEHGCAAPRRFELILEYVRLFPRELVARTPYVSFSPKDSAAMWRRVEQAWLRHLDEHPSGCAIARGFALFLAASDSERALGVLQTVERHNPEDPELLTDLGRICQEPARRLKFFLRAQAAGASQPNLLVWIATAALDAGELDRAERCGRELLALAARARDVHGQKLDWRERGHDLWNKALAETGDRATAYELVKAIGAHAYHKHWGHTVCGVPSLRHGDLSAALDHLRDSAEVPGDARLSSYGPSFRLAAELLQMGQWDAVRSYLRACRPFWDAPALELWMEDVDHRRVPNFGDR